ncbi:MAG: hypothetical protein ACK559_13500, partial [bacterium]
TKAANGTAPDPEIYGTTDGVRAAYKVKRRERQISNYVFRLRKRTKRTKVLYSFFNIVMNGGVVL